MRFIRLPACEQIQINRIVPAVAQPDKAAAAFEPAYELDTLPGTALQLVPGVERIIARRQTAQHEMPRAIRRAMAIKIGAAAIASVRHRDDDDSFGRPACGIPNGSLD